MKITVDNSRKIYENEDYDITMIEILKNIIKILIYFQKLMMEFLKKIQ